MSVQTVTDIIVNQQFNTSDLQKSAQNQISSSKSETSFSELVSFFQKDSDKISDASEKKAETGSAETAVKDVNEKKSDDSKISDTKSTEKSDETKETVKSEKVSEKEFDSVDENEEIKEKSDIKSDTKSKKISDNSKKSEKKSIEEMDLEATSRIDELVAAAKGASLENKNVKVDENQKSEKEIKIDTEEVAASKEFALQLAGENSLQSGELTSDNQDFDAEEFEKDFGFGQKKSEKTASLDKEGKITVEDLRTGKEITEEKADKNELKLKTELKVDNENTATITMDYAQSVEADVLSLNNQTAASNGSTYQQMLNNQVQNNVPEFVKAGNIVLKDNNQGTINLVLHPDDLGNVKIHLSLDGKTITGHITVASKEAMEVFKNNSETLREAFIKSGFDAANFDVSYSGNNSFGENTDFQRNDGRELFARRTYGDAGSFDGDFADELIQNSKNSDNFSINIVA